MWTADPRRTAPRAVMPAFGTAMCSLHVMWWNPNRSAVSAMRASSSIPAVASHSALTAGTHETIGLTSPTRTAGTVSFRR